MSGQDFSPFVSGTKTRITARPSWKPQILGCNPSSAQRLFAWTKYSGLTEKLKRHAGNMLASLVVLAIALPPKKGYKQRKTIFRYHKKYITLKQLRQ
jgi:hypothetical protein